MSTVQTSAVDKQNGYGHDEEHERYVTHTPPSPSEGMAIPRGSASAGKKPANSVAPVVAIQRLREADFQPSYAHDLGTGSIEHGFYGSCISGLGSVIGTIGAIPCCPCPNQFKEVRQGNVGLVSRFGKFYKSVDPGLVKINVLSEQLQRVDVKVQIISVPRQTVMTKDNVNVEIDSVLVWHVINPVRAAFSVTDVRVALVERAQTTLRQVVGNRSLQSTITEREVIALEIEQIVEQASETWGVKVESILIKDILFSADLQQSLSSAATQKRIGESKVIAARAEVDSAKLMREAADILSSPAAIQIRQLEALQVMARTANSKVIFVPVSLMGQGTMEASQLAAADPYKGHSSPSASGSGSSGGNAGMHNVGTLTALANA